MLQWPRHLLGEPPLCHSRHCCSGDTVPRALGRQVPSAWPSSTFQPQAEQEVEREAHDHRQENQSPVRKTIRKQMLLGLWDHWLSRQSKRGNILAIVC